MKEAEEIYEKMHGTLEHFEDSYAGCFENSFDSPYDSPLHAYADQYVENMGWYDAVPHESYIDLDAVVINLEASGWWHEKGHVFRPV